MSEAASEATCRLELACILNPCSTTHSRPLYMRRHKCTLTPFSFAMPLCTYCSHEAVQSSQLSKNGQFGGTLRSSSLPLGDSTIFLPFFSVGKYLDTESSNMPDSLRNWLLFNHCCHLDDQLPFPTSCVACPAMLRAILCNRLSCFPYNKG